MVPKSESFEKFWQSLSKKKEEMKENKGGEGEEKEERLELQGKMWTQN